MWRRLFATKSLEMLAAEAAGENRLHRVLGPIGLTSLGVGAIIGAGIFVMTGRVAAEDAGPGILVSFAIAGFACALAAFCYAEFSSLAPVAGSAYTYAYATLGELMAWIIGWDLILEYAMSAATVAAAWSEYLNKFLQVCFGGVQIPNWLCAAPMASDPGWLNLPAALVLAACTAVLVIGIRESAFSNTVMVIVKLGVVLFVIAAGLPYVDSGNWTKVPASARHVPTAAREHLDAAAKAKGGEKADAEPGQVKALAKMALASHLIDDAEAKKDAAWIKSVRDRYERFLPRDDADVAAVKAVLAKATAPAARTDVNQRLGLLGALGAGDAITALDERTRSDFLPFGLSGVIFGASIVFFAFIGFDSISTHSEEAINPQRDLPIGILTSLVLCSLLYVGVAAVVTGMIPYPDIDAKAAVASAFADLPGASTLAKASAALVALGGLAGMTSVLLITFLSQARIFLAMARDGLLPHAIFGVVHEKFRTPARSTILTGGLMMVVAAFTEITILEEMVNIGTFFAFLVVCAAVLILRVKRPDAPRPFRCPAVWVVAPLGVLVNLTLMLALPLATWVRLAVWLGIGLAVYFAFGYRYSKLAQRETGV